MVLVFILLGIIILLLLLFTIFLLSTLQIEIKNLKIGNKENNTRIKDKYEIKITLYFLEKIPFIWLNLNNKKLKKISNSEQLKKIDFREVEKNIKFNKETIEVIKNLKIKISELNLKINLGTEDVILTSYLIAFIASIIGIVLPHIAKESDIDNLKYIVNPIYQNKNEYHISLNSIISVKIVHIIYSMLIFVKKGSNKYERTSNRRSYA